ncbi:hypothetical protein B2G67_11645 [Microbacterium foliorum]|nr:hypothetical protein B2G67_11645 [Microbacterium foliorum]
MVFVVCGGVETEPQYIDYLKMALGLKNVHIRLSKLGKSPVEVVRRAIGTREDADEIVWALVDVDDFGSGVAEAVELGRQNGVQVAVSNPCFELWLVWHFEKLGGHLNQGQVQARAAKLELTYGKDHKSIHIDKLRDRYEHASAQAKRMRKYHAENETACPDDCPSTNVDLFVDSLLALEAR